MRRLPPLRSSPPFGRSAFDATSNTDAFRRGPGDTSGLVYYNALQVNNTTLPVKAEFTSVESSAIVSRPCEYHLSVIRFYLSARNLLPIFWWNQNQDPTIPQQYGTYQVSMSYAGAGGAVYSQRLLFRTQDLGGTSPPNPDRQIDVDNALYWGVYAHSAFIESLNSALKSVYSQLVLSGAGATSPPAVAGCRAPYMIFSPGTGLLSLVAARQFSEQYVGGNTVKIWMNAELYTFFSESLQYDDRFVPGTNSLGAALDFSLTVTDRGEGAPYQRLALILSPQWLSTATYVVNQLTEYNGVDYRALGPSGPTVTPPPLNPGLWVTVTGENPTDYSFTASYSIGDKVFYPSPTGGGWYVSLTNLNTGNLPTTAGVNWGLDSSIICYTVTQDYPSTYRWIAVQRYILIGNGLSTVNEFLPAANGGYNQTSIPFLIDFTPDYSSSSDAAGTGAGNILYTPTAEFKRIELQSDTPLKSITLSVSVMTNTGVLLPVYLGPQGSFSCKLLFERKRHGDTLGR